MRRSPRFLQIRDGNASAEIYPKTVAADTKQALVAGIKYWEIIADNLHKAGWSLGWGSALDLEGRTILIVDAHEDDGKRLVVRADEKLTAFVELERAIHAFAVSLIS